MIFELWTNFGLFIGGDVGFGVAFLAGIIAFLSPCILPIVPAYLGYFTGIELSDVEKQGEKKKHALRRKTFIQAVLFVTGFIIVFMLLGLASGTLGSLLSVNKELLQRLGGILMILLGLYVLEVFKIPWLYKQFKIDFHKGFTKWQSLNSFLTGLTFGFAWTPCIGPILASVLFLATFSGGSIRGVLLLLAFALGLAVPFLLLALSIQSVAPLLKKFNRYTIIAQKIAGVMLLIMGVLLILNKFAYLVGYFTRLSSPVI